MNEKLFVLTRQRGELLARIAAQREQLADEIGEEWQVPLTLADQGLAAVRYLRRHPLLIAAVMAVYIFRRRSAAGIVLGAWRVWKGYRILTSASGKSSIRG